MADLRFAAWLLWMTPLLAALSSCRHAARSAAPVCSVSPDSAASRNFLTDVFSEDLTALLRSLAFSFCLLRLIWDLMFATGSLARDLFGPLADRAGQADQAGDEVPGKGTRRRSPGAATVKDSRGSGAGPNQPARPPGPPRPGRPLRACDHVTHA